MEDVTTPAQARNFPSPFVYASITTKLDVLPSGMRNWRENRLIKLAQADPEADPEKIMEAAWGYREMPDGSQVGSADFGTYVHSQIEDLNTALIKGHGSCGLPVDPDWEKYTSGWLEWVCENSVEIVAAEEIICCHDMRVAGTMDCVARLWDEIILCDYKSREGRGKLKEKAYEKDICQLAVSAKMYREKHGLPYTPRVYTVLIDTDTGETHCKLWTVKAQEKGLKKFLAANQFYNAYYEL